MEISAIKVKELREMTGAGMMECKKALAESKGDMQEAIEALRKRGVAMAAKRAGRTAAEGTIGFQLSSDGRAGVLVEVNCETDFVAKTDDFQKLSKTAAALALQHKAENAEALLNVQHEGRVFRDLVTDANAKVGENVGVARAVLMHATQGQKLAQYIHAGSKIGVMVQFADPNNTLNDAVARDVAMHIAAMNPRFIRKENIPESVVAKEKEIQLARLAEEQKKPADVLEKIVVGRLNKFLSELCLDDQVFVRDPEGKLTVAKALANVDPQVRVLNFVRLEVGELAQGENAQ